MLEDGRLAGGDAMRRVQTVRNDLQNLLRGLFTKSLDVLAAKT